MRRFIFCLMIASMVAMPAYAAKQKISAKNVEKSSDAGMEPNPDTVAILQKIKGENKNLSYDYLGQRLNMNAWLLSGPNVMQIVYTTKDNSSAMLGGVLIGPDGNELSSTLTKDFMKQYPERAQEILAVVRNRLSPDKTTEKTADNSPSEILWQKLQQGGKITFGPETDAPIVYAFLDPAQPATKEVWTHLAPLAKAGKFTFNVLPIGLTTADSIMEIASTLGDKDPKGCWEKLLQGQTAIKTDTPDSSGVVGMKANVDIAQSLKLRTVPFIVYRDTTGKIRIIQGLPKDWDNLIKELSSLK